MTGDDTNDYSVISLGIDQGIANVGYGLTTINDDGEEIILHSGVFKTTTKHIEQERIRLIYQFINDLVDSYNVKVIGLEKLFFNPAKTGDGVRKNKSADMLRTQLVSGVIYLIAGQHGLPIADYTPGTVKKCVAGHGRASKDEVILKVKVIAERCGFTLKNEHQADAIGISLTALRKCLEEQQKKGVEENVK